MFGLFGSRIRLTRKQYQDIAGDACHCIRRMVEANDRVDTYLAEAIQVQPTPVQWARAIKAGMWRNFSGVLESAQKLDDTLRLGGSLMKQFIRLKQLVDRLECADLSDECVGPARAVVSQLSSVARILARIEKKHVQD